MLEQEGVFDQNRKQLEEQLRSTQNECAATKSKLAVVQRELTDLRGTKKSSESEMITEKNKALTDLETLQTEYRLVVERLKALETEIDGVNEQKKEVEGKLKSVQVDLAEHRKGVETLKAKAEEAKRQSEKVDGERSLERKELEVQIAALRGELDERNNAEEESHTASKEVVARLKREQKKQLSEQKKELLAEHKKELDEQKKELSNLRSSLAKETKARENAERLMEELAAEREEFEQNHQPVEKPRVAAKTKRKNTPPREKEPKAAKGSKATVTKVPVDNPRKRKSLAHHLTMEDLASSEKKPRRKESTTKTSEFSVTPFLKRQAQQSDTSTSRAASAAPDTSIAVENETTIDKQAGERSAIDSSFIDGSKPRRSLFAGANRKKKAPTAPPVRIPEEPEEEESRPAPATDSELADDSLLEIKVPKARPKPHAKTKGKAVSTGPVVISTLLLSSPERHDEPVSLPKVPVGKKKRKKPPGETSFLGIRPTVFDDDGSGRLNLNLDDGSQETQAAAGLAGQPPLLLPKFGAFNRELSPPKRRPEALKKMFAKR